MKNMKTNIYNRRMCHAFNSKILHTTNIIMKSFTVLALPVFIIEFPKKYLIFVIK